MESIKETFNNWVAGLQNYINSFSVEEKKNKIFYFSKFSVEVSEFYQIYTFVKTLKENIFKTLIEQFKFCVKELISFYNKNLNIKEKVIILYSSCLLIYYKKFCFDTNNSFEEFFDNDFIYVTTTTFGYQIVNQELFKSFIFYTYSKIKKEINDLDYNPIKNLKKYYYPENENKSSKSNIYINIIENDDSFDNKPNKINIKKNIKINSSRISTNTNSINNDYFPDPNIFLPRKKGIIEKNQINKRPNNIKLDKNKNINELNFTSKNNIINLNENDIEGDKKEELNIINENNLQKENSGFQEQVLTYLTSTKERIINLAFEMGYKGYFPIFNKNINDRFQEFNNISSNKFNIENKTERNLFSNNDFAQKPKTLNVNKNSINSINKKINKNEINSINNINQKLKPEIKHFSNQQHGLNIENQKSKNDKMEIENDFNNISDDDSNNNSKESEKNVNNSFFSSDIDTCCNFESLYNFYVNNSEDNVKIEKKSQNNDNNFTQTIISELSKYEVDDQIVKIIEEVARKIDSDYLGQAINNSPKNVVLINYFSCYMIEFTPEQLQNIEPKYKDLLENYCIKFIVLAKELYNTTMELFTTIYDLSFTNIDTFINLSKNCGIQIQYAQSLYNMFKEFSTLLLKKKESKSNTKKILQKLFKQQKLLWDKTITQKGQELTSFYKVQFV